MSGQAGAGTPASAGPPAPGLTDRERQVLLAIAAGRSNREIADSMHIGYRTAKTHVSHLHTLNCRDRAQPVISAYESRIPVPGSPLR